MKRDLLREAENLFSGDGGNVLALTVRRFFPDLVQAFVLYWLPEQAEDIYWLLVSSTEIAKIEIPRNQDAGECAATLEMVSVDAYSNRRLSRDVRRKMEVALALISDRRI
ncbi:hypothetical protein [Burkholderia sp. 3C]